MENIQTKTLTYIQVTLFICDTCDSVTLSSYCVDCENRTYKVDFTSNKSYYDVIGEDKYYE